jgi:hypothetical protein
MSRRILTPLDPIEQGSAPRPVPGVVFEKIDEYVSVEADTYTFLWKALRERGPYHDRRSRFR